MLFMQEPVLGPLRRFWQNGAVDRPADHFRLPRRGHFRPEEHVVAALLGAKVIKLFTPVFYECCNKLECLSLVGSSSLVFVRPGDYSRVEHMNSATLG
jgi:hypothetical protein